MLIRYTVAPVDDLSAAMHDLVTIVILLLFSNKLLFDDSVAISLV